MITKRGTGDLPRVYRPCSPAELYGQDEVKKIICNSLKENTVSHSLFFHGPSGTGKTTCARIIGMGLLCEKGPGPEPCGHCDQCRRVMQSNNVDFVEINAADCTGIDFMRKLKDGFHYAPMCARSKVFVFDESQRLSEAAQSMLLKEVEGLNEFTYIIFCSTDPVKMIEPLQNRCMPIVFSLVDDAEIRRLLTDVCQVEGLAYSNDVIDAIVKAAKGRPRNALFELQKATEAGAVKRNGRDQSLMEKQAHDETFATPIKTERKPSIMKNAEPQTESTVVRRTRSEKNPALRAPTNSPTSKLIYQTGDNRLLLIAPHGHNSDEPGTAEIVYQAKGLLGCGAIINAKVRKNALNYNRISQAKKDTRYIDTVREAVTGVEHSLVVFVHGIDDNNLKAEAERLGAMENTLHAVVGYGQSDNLCASKKTANALIKALSDNGVHAETALEVPDGYCAAHPNIMTQWFKANGFEDLANVEAIQIEFKAEGVRDADSRTGTAINLARALSEVTGVPLKAIAQKASSDNLPATVDKDPARLETTPKTEADTSQQEQEPDAELVNTAYKHLRDIFASANRALSKIEHTAMHRAGQYLIKTFYDDDYDLAAEGKKTRRASFRDLEKRFQSESKDTPKKSWLHNAVKLAVDEHRFSKLDDKVAVHAYGQLGLSQKVLLLPLEPLDKEKVAKEVAGMTVAATRKRIDALKAAVEVANALAVTGKVSDVHSDDERSQLKKTAKDLADSVEKSHRQITKQVAEIAKIETALDRLPATEGGFTEWTNENVNICNGCLNDCLYCYAKSEAHRRGQISKDLWVKQVVRPHDVSATRRFRPGWIGFPSTHDIIPEIIEDYLTVLGKLLLAGNKVLIVSKPRLECIEEICAATRFFKDKVMFRFTIGARSDDILRFWEPNAPTYAERKKALQHAYEAGYRTSVSAEPMLDADHAVDLVEDLASFINVDLWIGKMNHMPSIDKVQDPKYKAELKRIRAEQSEERIVQLYESLKGNCLVRWKKKTLPPALAEDHQRRRTEGVKSMEGGSLKDMAA